jgi:ABC-type antimicrobial peptide transport system permease subunit
MALGGLAVLLAAIGVYGVLSYSVARRTGEIGIRMALGARREQVLRFVLRDGLRLIGAGIVVGAVAALIGTRFLKAFLFGVEPLDPTSFAGAAALLLLIALGAAFVPAAHASRVDPLTALRHE